MSEVFFAISEKLPAWLSKLQSTYFFNVLRENIYFLKLNMIPTFFGLWDEKKWDIQSKNFFQGPTNKNSRFQRNISIKTDFSFEKVFFLLSFSEFQWFLWLFAKLFSQVCQTTDQRAERKKNGEINLENLFFQSILVSEEKKLGLSAKQ